MDLILYLIGGTLFVFSAAAHVYVRIALRPPEEQTDEYHWEFEDHDPDYARYSRRMRATFAGMAAGALLLFTAMVI
jgi:hypothetical protein